MKFPTMDRNNVHYTLAFYAVSFIRGTSMSVLAHIAFIWAIVRLWQGKLSLPKDPVVRLVAFAFALYPLTEALSALINNRGWPGLWDAFEQVLFLAIIPVFARLSISDPREIAEAAIKGAAAGAGAMAVISLVQVGVMSLPRASGGFSSPGGLAHVATVLFGLLLCLAPVADRQGRKIALVGALAALLAIILSGTRTYWLLTLAVGVISVFAWPNVRAVRPKPKILLVAASALAVLVLIAAPMVERRVEALASDVQKLEDGNYRSSLGYRVVLWTEGLRLAQERPLFGYGPDAIYERLGPIEDRIERRYNHFHSFIVTAMVQGGLMLLAAVLVIPLAVLVAVARPSAAPLARQGRIILLMLMMVYYGNGIIGGLFGYDFTDALLIYTVVLGLMLMSKGADSEPQAV